MVNSGSYDSAGSEGDSVKGEFTQLEDSVTQTAASPRHIVGACVTEDNYPATTAEMVSNEEVDKTQETAADSITTERENGLKDTLTSLLQFDLVKNEHKYPSETKTSLQCSVPLHKVKDVLELCTKNNTEANSLVSNFILENLLKKTNETKTADVENSQKTTPKRLLCLFCDRTFTSINLKQKHVDRCHPTGQSRRSSSRIPGYCQSATACWFCSKLNHTEHSLKQLLEHLVNEHSNRYFACLTCQERFSSQKSLREHNKIIHDIHEESKQIEKKVDDLENSTETTTQESSPAVETKEEEPDEEKGASSPEITPKTSTRRRNTTKSPKLEPNEPPAKSKSVDFEDDIQVNVINNNDIEDVEVKSESDDNEKKYSAPIKTNRNRKKISVKSTKNGVRNNIRTTRAAVKQINNRINNKKRNKSKQNKLVKKDTKIYKELVPKKAVNSSSVFSLVNLFTYKYEKIYDHSSDSIKDGNSGKFDAVFDKEFYVKTVSNIKENLLFHLDGKLNRNVQSENRISNFEHNSVESKSGKDSSTEGNFGCDLSLNAVTPVATLLASSQYGEDFDAQIEYAAKATQKKAKKDKSFKYKFTNRKYNSLFRERGDHTDLTCLDMWTQLKIKERQHVLHGSEDSTLMNQNAKTQVDELNSILDKRGPFEDLVSEAQAALGDSAKQRKNSEDKNIPNKDTYKDVNIILEDILSQVFTKSEELKVETTEELSDTIDEEDEKPLINDININLELPNYLNLQNTPNKNEIKLDETDKTLMICVAKDETNKSVELSGEWARSRMYICATCALKLPNIKSLDEHKNNFHPHIWCTHYEFVGKQSEFYRHLGIPGLGKVGLVEMQPMTKLWQRSDARMCSKCAKQCHNLGELHRHMLECGGDWTWMLARKKCKYRPYGARTRRRRQRGYKRTCNPDLPRTPRGPKVKSAQVGPRVKPSDAETIERMLANLPAKRNRKVVSMRDGIQGPRKPYIRSKLKTVSLSSHNEKSTKKIIKTRISQTTKQALKNTLKRKMTLRTLRNRNHLYTENVEKEYMEETTEKINNKNVNNKKKIVNKKVISRVLGSKILDSTAAIVSRRHLVKAVIQNNIIRRTRLRSRTNAEETKVDIDEIKTKKDIKVPGKQETQDNKKNVKNDGKNNTEDLKDVKITENIVVPETKNKKSAGKRITSLLTSKSVKKLPIKEKPKKEEIKDTGSLKEEKTVNKPTAEAENTVKPLNKIKRKRNNNLSKEPIIKTAPKIKKVNKTNTEKTIDTTTAIIEEVIKKHTVDDSEMIPLIEIIRKKTNKLVKNVKSLKKTSKKPISNKIHNKLTEKSVASKLIRSLSIRSSKRRKKATKETTVVIEPTTENSFIDVCNTSIENVAENVISLEDNLNVIKESKEIKADNIKEANQIIETEKIEETVDEAIEKIQELHLTDNVLRKSTEDLEAMPTLEKFEPLPDNLPSVESIPILSPVYTTLISQLNVNSNIPKKINFEETNQIIDKPQVSVEQSNIEQEDVKPIIVDNTKNSNSTFNKFKNKFKRSGKGLNDCINMLRCKLEKKVEPPLALDKSNLFILNACENRGPVIVESDKLVEKNQEVLKKNNDSVKADEIKENKKDIIIDSKIVEDNTIKIDTNKKNNIIENVNNKKESIIPEINTKKVIPEITTVLEIPTYTKSLVPTPEPIENQQIIIENEILNTPEFIPSDLQMNVQISTVLDVAMKNCLLECVKTKCEQLKNVSNNKKINKTITKSIRKIGSIRKRKKVVQQMAETDNKVEENKPKSLNHAFIANEKTLQTDIDLSDDDDIPLSDLIKPSIKIKTPRKKRKPKTKISFTPLILNERQTPDIILQENLEHIDLNNSINNKIDDIQAEITTEKNNPENESVETNEIIDDNNKSGNENDMKAIKEADPSTKVTEVDILNTLPDDSSTEIVKESISALPLQVMNVEDGPSEVCLLDKQLNGENIDSINPSKITYTVNENMQKETHLDSGKENSVEKTNGRIKKHRKGKIVKKEVKRRSKTQINSETDIDLQKVEEPYDEESNKTEILIIEQHSQLENQEKPSCDVPINTELCSDISKDDICDEVSNKSEIIPKETKNTEKVLRKRRSRSKPNKEVELDTLKIKELDEQENPETIIQKEIITTKPKVRKRYPKAQINQELDINGLGNKKIQDSKMVLNIVKGKGRKKRTKQLINKKTKTMNPNINGLLNQEIKQSEIITQDTSVEKEKIILEIDMNTPKIDELCDQEIQQSEVITQIDNIKNGKEKQKCSKLEINLETNIPISIQDPEIQKSKIIIHELEVEKESITCLEQEINQEENIDALKIDELPAQEIKTTVIIHDENAEKEIEEKMHKLDQVLAIEEPKIVELCAQEIGNCENGLQIKDQENVKGRSCSKIQKVDTNFEIETPKINELNHQEIIQDSKVELLEENIDIVKRRRKRSKTQIDQDVKIDASKIDELCNESMKNSEIMMLATTAVKGKRRRSRVKINEEIEIQAVKINELCNEEGAEIIVNDTKENKGKRRSRSKVKINNEIEIKMPKNNDLCEQDNSEIILQEKDEVKGKTRSRSKTQIEIETPNIYDFCVQQNEISELMTNKEPEIGKRKRRRSKVQINDTIDIIAPKIDDELCNNKTEGTEIAVQEKYVENEEEKEVDMNISTAAICKNEPNELKIIIHQENIEEFLKSKVQNNVDLNVSKIDECSEELNTPIIKFQETNFEKRRGRRCSKTQINDEIDLNVSKIDEISKESEIIIQEKPKKGRKRRSKSHIYEKVEIPKIDQIPVEESNNSETLLEATITKKEKRKRSKSQIQIENDLAKVDDQELNISEIIMPEANVEKPKERRRRSKSCNNKEIYNDSLIIDEMYDEELKISEKILMEENISEIIMPEANVEKSKERRRRSKSYNNKEIDKDSLNIDEINEEELKITEKILMVENLIKPKGRKRRSKSQINKDVYNDALKTNGLCEEELNISKIIISEENIVKPKERKRRSKSQTNKVANDEFYEKELIESEIKISEISDSLNETVTEAEINNELIVDTQKENELLCNDVNKSDIIISENDSGKGIKRRTRSKINMNQQIDLNLTKVDEIYNQEIISEISPEKNSRKSRNRKRNSKVELNQKIDFEEPKELQMKELGEEDISKLEVIVQQNSVDVIEPQRYSNEEINLEILDIPIVNELNDHGPKNYEIVRMEEYVENANERNEHSNIFVAENLETDKINIIDEEINKCGIITLEENSIKVKGRKKRSKSQINRKKEDINLTEPKINLLFDSEIEKSKILTLKQNSVIVKGRKRRSKSQINKKTEEISFNIAKVDDLFDQNLSQFENITGKISCSTDINQDIDNVPKLSELSKEETNNSEIILPQINFEKEIEINQQIDFDDSNPEKISDLELNAEILMLANNIENVKEIEENSNIEIIEDIDFDLPKVDELSEQEINQYENILKESSKKIKERKKHSKLQLNQELQLNVPKIDEIYPKESLKCTIKLTGKNSKKGKGKKRNTKIQETDDYELNKINELCNPELNELEMQENNIGKITLDMDAEPIILEHKTIENKLPGSVPIYDEIPKTPTIIMASDDSEDELPLSFLAKSLIENNEDEILNDISENLETPSILANNDIALIEEESMVPVETNLDDIIDLIEEKNVNDALDKIDGSVLDITFDIESSSNAEKSLNTSDELVSENIDNLDNIENLEIVTENDINPEILENVDIIQDLIPESPKLLINLEDTIENANLDASSNLASDFITTPDLNNASLVIKIQKKFNCKIKKPKKSRKKLNIKPIVKNIPKRKIEEENINIYCEICNKSFRRPENLLKHKRTLTHISKLSEIEAKENQAKQNMILENEKRDEEIIEEIVNEINNFEKNKETEQEILVIQDDDEEDEQEVDENKTVEKELDEENQLQIVEVEVEDKAENVIPVVETIDLIDDLSTDVEKSSESFQQNDSINNKNSNLKLVDIIKGVLDKPVNDLNMAESVLLSKNITNSLQIHDNEPKRYKSLGERKSFDSDSYLVSQKSAEETPVENNYNVSKESNNQMLSKQLTLLENIIEKSSPELNYSIDDSISYSSNNFDETIQVRNITEKDLFRATEYPIKFNEPQIQFSHNTDIISSFIKPDGHFTHFENHNHNQNFAKPVNNYDEATQQQFQQENEKNYKENNSTRKILNRDEELFLECCSLLKSGSEISSVSKKSTKQIPLHNFSNEGAWIEQKQPNNYIQRDSYSWLAQGSRVETPIGEPYVNNDWSNSNSAVSSEWLAQKAASPDQPVENNTLSKKANSNADMNYSNIQFEDISIESSLTRNTESSTTEKGKENIPIDFHNVKFSKTNLHEFKNSGESENYDEKSIDDINLDSDVVSKDETNDAMTSAVEEEEEGDKEEKENKVEDNSSGKEDVVVDENLKRHVVSAFGGLMAKALKCRLKAVVRRSNKAKEKRTFVSTLQPIITEYTVPVKKSKLNIPETISEPSKNSSDCPKKIVTKGAMKVFEGLKVSIPTQDLDLKEVLKCKNIEPKETTYEEEHQVPVPNTKKKGKRRNMFKKFGNKLGLKETKKKNSKKHKNHSEDKKSHDVYEFEESEDNTSIFNAKSLTVFRNIRKPLPEVQDDIYNSAGNASESINKISEPLDNKLIIDSESETDRYYDSVSFEENSLSSESVTTQSADLKLKSSSEKSKKDSHKKCMIMGRIFKNASKPKLEDKIPEIRDISSEENSKLVENFVESYSSIDNIESTIVGDNVIPGANNLTIINSANKMTQNEMNFLFDKLLQENKNTALINKEVISPEIIPDIPLVEKVHQEVKGKEEKEKPKVAKPKKRKSHHSDDSASTDEFTLTGKQAKSSKKHKKHPRKTTSKKKNGGINLEDEMKECIGVAGRKSQRKCTSGKQNVLAEFWSSDESETDFTELCEAIPEPTGNDINEKLPVENKIDEISPIIDNVSINSVLMPTKPEELKIIPERDITKVINDLYEFEPELEDIEEPILPLKKDLIAEKQKPEKYKKSMKIKPENKRHSKSKEENELEGRKTKRKGEHKKKRSSHSESSNTDSLATSRRKRNAVETLYYWSSTSDDEFQDMIEVKPVREDTEDDRPMQHGWIVGDSPKKLVTMLAQAKGKKIDCESVKEQGKKNRTTL